MHLLDSFAVIAVQHNSGTTPAPRVAASHYPPCRRTPAAEPHASGEKKTERVPTGYRVNAHAHTVVLTKKLRLRHSPWPCSFFRTAEWPRGLKFPLRLSPPVEDERR